MSPNKDNFCDYHHEFDTRMKLMKQEIDSLWKKWDRLQVLVIVTLVGVIGNLLMQVLK